MLIDPSGELYYQSDAFIPLLFSIQYSYDNYYVIGGWFNGVNLTTFSILPSMNFWLLPGITINRGFFFNNPHDAIEQLVHEPLHDFTVWHGTIQHIVGTTYETTSPFTDAFSRFYWLLFYSKGCVSGKSLWSQIIDKVGPPPAIAKQKNQ